MPVQLIPNLRHLRALSLTARYKSVNRAAAEICLSQPAVTQAISKLEAEFGAFFFERTSSGMFCSEFGLPFLRRVDRALDILSRSVLDAAAGGRPEAPHDPLSHLTTVQLRSLIAFSDTGSFEAAADALGISLLSMQRTAASLERAVGAKLFPRAGKLTMLSSAGEKLAQGAKLAAREIELGSEEIENVRGYKTGRIVIGSMPLARVDLVPHAVTQLLRTYPDIRVRITEGSYSALMTGLCNGDIDLVVGALRNPATYNDIQEVPLFDDPISVVVRSSHPLSRQDNISLAETIGYPWIVPPTGTPTRQIFSDVFRTRALMEPKRLVEVSSTASLRALLLESDRVAFISRRQLNYEEQHGLIKVLPIELAEAHRPIGIMLRDGWEPSAAQGELVRLLGLANLPSKSEPQVPTSSSKSDARRIRTGISLVGE